MTKIICREVDLDYLASVRYGDQTCCVFSKPRVYVDIRIRNVGYGYLWESSFLCDIFRDTWTTMGETVHMRLSGMDVSHPLRVVPMKVLMISTRIFVISIRIVILSLRVVIFP